MVSHKSSIMICALSSTVLGGCSTLTSNQYPSNYQNDVNPVMTEYSQALACVGDLVNESDKGPLTIYVRDIEDETVPSRFRERRLSKGGAWWFHTAIDKMQSDRISSTTSSPGKKQREKDNYLILSGAWTQDDHGIGRNGKSVGFNNLGNGILDRFGWSNSQETSVIAGDFVSTIDNKVVHASAISLAVSGSNNNFELRIDDGSRRLDLGLTDVVNEGPQFAQRRIAESAALVHVAAAFDLDYRSCVQQGWSNPSDYQADMNDFMTSSQEQQSTLVQAALSDAGFYIGEIDGKWGKQSERALNMFMLDKNLTPSGKPTPEVYGMLLKNKVVAVD